ncbi:MAG: SigB/SigF/SigG family RNA polymerase sigma factor [Acidimicrobiales bacterium]
MADDDDRKRELAAKFKAFAKTRDDGLRAELIEAHVGLAEYLARRFNNRGEPIDDLIQVASTGLIKAVDRFEPERGLQFSTYATHTIVGELKRHFRDKGWAVRVPRRMQELHLLLGQVVSTLGQDLGRSPTIAEIAEAAEITDEQVLEVMEAGQAYRFASLDAPAPGNEDDGGGSIAASLGADDEQLADTERRVALQPLLASLPERQRMIVYYRFFEGLTQSDIANTLGISQMHVSRLLARSLATMRAAAEPE